MRIYVAHPTEMNYKKDIYEPLKNEEFFNNHELILPHEKSALVTNTRQDYKNIDIMIAECSRPSTGVGIELGWSFDDEKPTICFRRVGTKLSSAVMAVATEIIEYENTQDFVEKVKSIIQKFGGQRVQV